MYQLRINELSAINVNVYKNDLVVEYKMRDVGEKGGRGKTDTIKGYSDKSMRRLAFVANNTDVEFSVMATLTYPEAYPVNGDVCKSHLNRFLNSLRRKGISYLWFLEFQNRGAPHFHVLMNGRLDYKYVAQRWYGIVGSGDEKHLSAGTRVEKLRTVDGAARYATKYAYKREQKIPPPQFQKVGRFWGHSKDVKPEVKSYHRSVTFAQLLDFCADNEKARQRINDWIDGNADFPLSVLFGCGRSRTIDTSGD